VQVAYQYGNATQFYVRDVRNDAAGPFGRAPTRKVNLINLDVRYGLTDRWSLALTVPFSSGSGALEMGTVANHSSHSFKATGLGDISLQGEYWLTDPARASRVTGSVGLGVHAPTGSDHVQGTVYSPAAGTDVTGPIDEAYQLGSGGWALLVSAQATASVRGPFSAYASGYYGVSLEEHNDVLNLGVALRGVPDTYSGRLGVGYRLPFARGLVGTFGGRINGVTVRDLIGGSDLYWRRPGYEVYYEPGLSWTLGSSTATLSVPLRAYQMKMNSALDESIGRVIGASFVRHLVIASYSRRF